MLSSWLTASSPLHQVLFRRNQTALNCPSCTGSVRDLSFIQNATGVFLKAGIDQSVAATVYTNTVNINGSIPKGTAYADGAALPQAPAANPYDASWISAVNATLTGSNQL